MACTCANAGRRVVERTPKPLRLFVYSDDERIGRQLAILGHAVFVVRPARHPDGASPAMLERFRADAVITDRTDADFGNVERVPVRIPGVCDDCAAYAHQPAIADVLSAAVAGVTASGNAAGRNVIISGYYGAKNTGDNLLLEAIARALVASDPTIRISVAATNPAEVERSHGFPAFSRKELETITPYLDTCTGFVLGGGGVWNDYNFNELGGVAMLFDAPIASVPGWTQTQLLAQLLGVRTHAYGIGVGPLTDDGARALVHLAAVGMDSIVVRDSSSRALLEQLDVGAAIAPDPVYGLALPTSGARPGEQRYIALNLRDWQFDDADYRSHLRDALTTWCRAHSMTVVGVPMQPSDVKTLQAFLQDLPADIAHTTLRWQHDPSTLLAALQHAEFVVAMRLHTCLLAHRLGRSVVGLSYDPKVREHFVELHRSDFALTLSSDASAIGDAFAAARSGLASDTVARIAQLESAAAAGLQELAARIAAAPEKRVPATRTYPRTPAAEPEPRKGFLGRMRG